MPLHAVLFVQVAAEMFERGEERGQFALRAELAQFLQAGAQKVRINGIEVFIHRACPVFIFRKASSTARICSSTASTILASDFGSRPSSGPSLVVQRRNELLARDADAHGVDQMIGDVDDGGFQFGHALGRRVVKRHRLHQHRRIAPALQQLGGNLLVVVAENFFLRVAQKHALALIKFKHGLRPFRRLRQQHQPADIVQQAGHEKLVRLGQAPFHRQQPRGDAHRQAVTPERILVHEIVRHAFELFQHARRHDHVLDLLDAQQAHGLGHRAQAGWQSRKTGCSPAATAAR